MQGLMKEITEEQERLKNATEQRREFVHKYCGTKSDRGDEIKEAYSFKQHAESHVCVTTQRS